MATVSNKILTTEVVQPLNIFPSIALLYDRQLVHVSILKSYTHHKLTRGLSFALTVARLPTDDIACNVAYAISQKTQPMLSHKTKLICLQNPNAGMIQ